MFRFDKWNNHAGAGFSLTVLWITVSAEFWKS